MSRTIGASLLSHFGLDVTTVTICYHILRKDGTELGFTDHDEDLTVSGLTYQSLAAADSSALKSMAGLSVDIADASIVLDAAGITKEDIMAGRYENAALWIFAVNYSAIAAQGSVTLSYGRIGEVKLNGEVATCEYRSLTQLLQKKIGRTYTPGCDAQLGDTRCGVDLDASPSSYKVNDTVAGVTSRAVFTASGTGDADYINGRIVWTSGDNNGLSMEIKTWPSASNTVTLILPMPFTIAVSDTFTAYVGCNKTFDDCKDRFSNGDNFRGFPHVPGFDKLHEHSGWR